MKRVLLVFLCLWLCLVGQAGAEQKKLTSTTFLGSTFGSMWLGVSKGFFNAELGGINMASMSMLASSAAASYLLYQTRSDQIESRQFKLGLDHQSTSILSKVGNMLPYTLLFGFFAAGQFLPTDSAAFQKSFAVGVDLAATLGLTYMTTGVLKGSIERERPNASNSNSFPSNHTAGAFAAAGVIAYHYPLYLGIPSLLAATAVGLSRVDLDVHFPSDVIAGAGIGLAYATAIAYQRHRATTSLVVPIASEGTYGLSYVKPF